MPFQSYRLRRACARARAHSTRTYVKKNTGVLESPEHGGDALNGRILDKIAAQPSMNKTLTERFIVAVNFLFSFPARSFRPA